MSAGEKRRRDNTGGDADDACYWRSLCVCLFAARRGEEAKRSEATVLGRSRHGRCRPQSRRAETREISRISGERSVA